MEPPTKEKVVKDLVENLALGIADVRDLVEMFNGRKGDEAHENVLFYLKTYEDLLSLHVNDESLLEVDKNFRSKASSWRNELCGIRGALEEKTEGEDRAMKEMNKLVTELEEEVENYYSDRTTKKYQNIQTRMKEVTWKMTKLKPSCSHKVEFLDEVKMRIATLWKEFEDRSESLVDMLSKNMEVGGGSNGRNDRERNLSVREDAIRKYKEDMLEVVKVCLRTYRDKFSCRADLDNCAEDIVSRKIMDEEILRFNKEGKRSWAEFQVSEASKKDVAKFMSSYLKKKFK